GATRRDLSAQALPGSEGPANDRLHGRALSAADRQAARRGPCRRSFYRLTACAILARLADQVSAAVMISAAASVAMTAGRLSFRAVPPIGQTSFPKSSAWPISRDSQLRKVVRLVFEPIMPT